MFTPQYKLTEVSSATLSRLLLDFQAAGKSHATCVKLYTVISLLFKMAYLDDSIDRNPMDKVQRPKPRTNCGTASPAWPLPTARI